MSNERFWPVCAVTVGAIALLIVTTAAAQSSRPDEGERKQAERLQTQAKDLDTDAAKVTATPEGQKRVTEAIAKQFKVPEAVITDLRTKKMGFGEITIALALSQELMKRDTTLTQQQALDTILAKRATGEGWGKIAHDLHLKLGHVVHEVHEADKHVEHIATMEKAEKHEKAEKVDKVEKVEKTEKPERVDKVERVERRGR